MLDKGMGGLRHAPGAESKRRNAWRLCCELNRWRRRRGTEGRGQRTEYRGQKEANQKSQMTRFRRGCSMSSFIVRDWFITSSSKGFLSKARIRCEAAPFMSVLIRVMGP